MRLPQERFCSLEFAAGLVQDGDTLALGGMTLYRRPVAFVRALLGRAAPPQDLTLLCFTAGYESDLLLGAGCVKSVRSAYFGLEVFGFAPMFTQMAQDGAIEIIEESEASIVTGIRASLGQVSSGLSAAWLGTDMLQLRPDVKLIQDPYSGEELVAFPAIHCDVAVIHGLKADRHGNVLLNNNLGIDMELAYASKRVICTVEEIVEDLERDTQSVILPYPAADHIVMAERGAAPSSCYPFYPIDGYELLRYTDACAAGQFAAYLASILHQGLNPMQD